MSKSEDYLDSLLNSVTKKLDEIDEDYEKKKNSRLPNKTQKALNHVKDEHFLNDFQNEIDNDVSDDDLNRFLDDFESDMFGDDVLSEEKGDDYLSELDSIVNESKYGLFSSADEEMFGDMGQVADETVDKDLDVAAANTSEVDLENSGSEDVLPKAESVDAGFSDPGQSSEVPVNVDDTDDAKPGAGSVPVDKPGTETQVAKPVADAPADPASDMGQYEALFDDGDMFQKPSDDEDDEPQIIDESNLDNIDLDAAINGMQTDDSLAGIVKMLDDDEAGIEIDEDNLADPDSMQAAKDAAADNNKKRKKGKKSRKSGDGNEEGGGFKLPGFLARFLDIMFGEEEEEDDGEGTAEKSDSPEALAEESSQVLKEMENEDAAASTGSSDDGDKKKKKKEKKKKEKKEKPKKEPKPKKPPKPKKEKVQEPKGKPLPKVPVVMIVIIAISLFVLIFLGTNLLGYSNMVQAAREDFDKGNYVQAYAYMAGADIKEEDKGLFESAKALASVQQELDAYYALMNVKKYDLALDALIRGHGHVAVVAAKAEEWGISLQLYKLRDEIEKQLKDQFNVTPEVAEATYAIESREDYSIVLHGILESLELPHN
ncbi:MAG: hypothetical protein K5929_09240 [Lachnospiraceae bacterium]|nr:hypothetical protein [Lachnospiraceae bacterium]